MSRKWTILDTWDPDDLSLLAGTFFNLGLTAFRMGRHEEALRYFRKVIEIEPDDAETLCLIGQTHDKLGNYTAAERSLRRSLELNPFDARTHYDLGNLFLKIEGKRKDAKRLFEQAIELDPEYVWPHYCLGCWYALRGRKSKAFESLERALEKGFWNREWIEADKDLESLRADPRFAKLMRKYFGEGAAEAFFQAEDVADGGGD